MEWLQFGSVFFLLSLPFHILYVFSIGLEGNGVCPVQLLLDVTLLSPTFAILKKKSVTVERNRLQ